MESIAQIIAVVIFTWRIEQRFNRLEKKLETCPHVEEKGTIVQPGTSF